MSAAAQLFVDDDFLREELERPATSPEGGITYLSGFMNSLMSTKASEAARRHQQKNKFH
jgi:hypothetical protein